MAEKTEAKSKTIIIVIAVIVVVALAGLIIYKVQGGSGWQNSKKAADIVINDSDSKEVKTEKIEKKIELINQEIEKVQAKIEPESQKLNKLYEDYVGVMNEYQVGVPANQ